MSESGSSEATDSTRYFKIVLSYRGTAYNGWQYQPHSPSVEGHLRNAIAQLSSGPFETAGASRTDTGVHAMGQCCRICIDTSLDVDTLARALHALTPQDIAIRSVCEVDAQFKPCFSAIQKRYLYRIDNGRVRSPFAQDLHWWYAKPLDVSAMERAAEHLLGTHDFDAFRNVSKDPPEDFIRTIQGVGWTKQGSRLTFQVVGDGFLYKMVRNIVGTFVEIGLGRRDPDSVPSLLRSRDRHLAGQTAPGHGLFLMEVRYPEDPELEIDSDPFIPG